MKISIGLIALMLTILAVGSGCATLNYSAGEAAERINWREYNDF
jgi:hypothetical protein